MSLRILPRVFVTLCLASLIGAGAASADEARAFRFTYGAPSAAEALGPGAARGVKIIINGGGTRPNLGRVSTEGVPFEIINVTFLDQNAPECDTPKIDVKGDAITCMWAKDCALPLESLDLCVRTNLPIFSIEAYFIDEFEGFLAAAEVTDLPGACGTFDCDGAVAVMPYIWPPNHKLTPVTIAGVSGGVGAVSIVATGITQDEGLNGRGDGNSCPDGVIEEGAAWVRMERSGKGNGRVYVVSFTATDETGATCDGQVRVCVPHNPGSPCVDDGQSVNSLGPCPSGGLAAPTEDLRVASTTRVAMSGGIARLEFSLPSAAQVDVGVFDVAGRRVLAVESGQRSSGAQKVSWNVSSLAQGVYFVRLRAGETLVSRTLFIAD